MFPYCNGKAAPSCAQESGVVLPEKAQALLRVLCKNIDGAERGICGNKRICKKSS